MSTRVPPLQVVCDLPLEWTAGYDHLLVAVRHALEAGAALHLTIAADGPAAAHVRYDIVDLALRDAVTLLEPAAVLPAGEVYAFAALGGDYTANLRAAIGLGLLVVAFDRPEYAGVLEERVDVVVPNRDAAALGRALTRLGTDSVLRTASRSAAQRRGAGGAMSA